MVLRTKDPPPTHPGGTFFRSCSSANGAEGDKGAGGLCLLLPAGNGEQERRQQCRAAASLPFIMPRQQGE